MVAGEIKRMLLKCKLNWLKKTASTDHSLSSTGLDSQQQLQYVLGINPGCNDPKFWDGSRCEISMKYHIL